MKVYSKAHTFLVSVATKIGLIPAILLTYINFWCDHNESNGKQIHDGVAWTYNTINAFRELFPYMGDKQIRNALNKLQDGGYIRVGNFNKAGYDRTHWYSVTEKGINLLNHCDCSFGERANGFGERANGNDQKGEPIPVIYTDIDTGICEDSSNRGITEADTEKETIPYTQILRLYNESCPSLAQVRNLSAISSQRKKAIKARYEEWGKSIDPFRECFRRAEASDFLTGRSGKWKATGIDWLLKPSNFSKIMEGAYDNRGKTPAVSTPAENLSYSEMMARQEEERRRRRLRDERVISMQG